MFILSIVESEYSNSFSISKGLSTPVPLSEKGPDSVILPFPVSEKPPVTPLQTLYICHMFGKREVKSYIRCFFEVVYASLRSFSDRSSLNKNYRFWFWLSFVLFWPLFTGGFTQMCLGSCRFCTFYKIDVFSYSIGVYTPPPFHGSHMVQQSPLGLHTILR